MNDLTHMTLADARDALKAKKITAVELTDAHVAAVSAAAPQELRGRLREFRSVSRIFMPRKVFAPRRARTFSAILSPITNQPSRAISGAMAR
jgi:Asp-tRNA(Asn)/Glu-tRNA(Gln) amidotransferase A subunit family amidase